MTSEISPTRAAGQLYSLALQARGRFTANDLLPLRSTGAQLVEAVLGLDASSAKAIRGVDVSTPLMQLATALGNMPGDHLAAELEAASNLLRLYEDSDPAARTQHEPRLHIEPRLWFYVSGIVEQGEWRHVPSAAANFLEQELRDWAGTGDIAINQVITDLFKKGGKLVLSDDEGHRQGWEQLIRGFFMAPRNAVQHGVPSRDDLREYATGFLGTASLVLLEVRRRYGTPPGRES